MVATEATLGIRAELRRVRNSTLARNTGWMLAGQGASVVLQAGYFILLARLLGLREYGIYSGAFALASLVSPYSSLGAGTVMLRWVGMDRRLFRSYWGNLIVITFLVGAVIALVLRSSARFLISPESASLAFLAALSTCLLNQLTAGASQVFQVFDEVRVTAVLSLSANLLRVLLVAALFLTTRHATALQWSACSVIISALAAIAAITAVTRRFGRPHVAIRLLLVRLLEGTEYAFAASTASLYNDLDKAMLSHYGLNAANGLYTMAYRIIDICSMPVVALRDAALPRFFKEGAQGVGRAAQLARQLLVRALPVAVFTAISIFLVAPLMTHLVGGAFAESVIALRWLCLIPLLRSLHQIAGSALTGAGLQRYRTISQCSAALLNFVANLVLIPWYGWRGAAWASLISDGGLGLANLFTLTIVRHETLP